MFLKLVKKIALAVWNLPLTLTPIERRMQNAAYKNINTVQDLVRCTYRWYPDHPVTHHGSTMMLMRKELRALLSRPSVGIIDMYSKVRLDHYEHPEGSEHGYYEVVVCDDRGSWTVLPLMLMLHFTEREYYLVTADQVQGPVCRSSIIEV